MQLTEDVLDQLQLCFNQSKTEITHFNRGFRFLGVDFIRSLVFKSEYPEKTVISIDRPKKTAKKVNKAETLLTEMQQAFLDAGITPGQFIPKQVAPSPISF